MADKSAIEWTDATWNPTVGCSIVSPGCTNCYAMHVAHGLERRFGSKKYGGLTKVVNGNVVWTGEVRLDEDALSQPLKWKRGRRIFVNSMSDLFHEALEDWQIAMVFGVMTCATQHTYQILTKRAERMQALVSSESFWDQVNAFSQDNAFEHSDSTTRSTTDYRAISDDHDPENPPPNIWLGVSCERQQEADERIPQLRETPAAVRFISFEPLLGHIEPDLHGIHWAITGGESGANARPMHPRWPRRLRNICAERGVAFFFKQWGQWVPHDPQPGGDLGGDVRSGRVRIVHPTSQTDVEVSVATDGRSTIPGSRYMERVGKKAAGRLLDGKEHNEFPISLAPQDSSITKDDRASAKVGLVQ